MSLRQATNEIFIEGILAENDISYGSFSKNGKTIESIGGKIVVKVCQTINGVMKELMIPVHMFSTKYKNDGNPNPAYTSIETVMNEYTSIAASDEENADRVRISKATIEMNEYYPTPDKLSSFPRIQASFVNRISKDAMKEGGKAEGQIEFCVAEKIEEIVNEEPTGRVLIRGIVPQYGGKVDVVPFYAVGEKVLDVVNNYWNEGDTVRAKVKLNFSSDTKEIVQEEDFGEPTIKTHTINISEIVIAGGKQDPYEDEAAFDAAGIQAGLADRKARLEALKAKGAAKKTAPAAKKFDKNDLGF